MPAFSRARVAAAIVLVVAFATACTSPTSDKATTGASGASAGPQRSTSTVGITDKTVTISLIVADLSILAKQHLAPDLGDPVKVAKATVDEINDNGGVAGRKLVLKPHEIVNAPIATLAVLQRACVQATEEDKPMAVLIGPAVFVNVVQCAAVEHKQLAITMDSWPQQVYDDADGRVFGVATSLSVDIERQYEALPALMQHVHALDGKTVGILNSDLPFDRTAAGKALKSGLAKAGIKLAAEATVPFPEGSLTCTQTDTAIQRLKDAKVDFVFLVAQNLCGAALIKAADAAGYTPQWATVGNNVTNTVAQFAAPAKDNYDGAWGVNGAFPEPSKEGKACVDNYTRRTGTKLVPRTDSYGFAAVVCLQIQTLADAVNHASKPLNQGAVMTALEAMQSLPLATGPNGSLAPTKHDAGNYVFLSKYSAAQGRFVPYDDYKPLLIP